MAVDIPHAAVEKLGRQLEAAGGVQARVAEARLRTKSWALSTGARPTRTVLITTRPNLHAQQLAEVSGVLRRHQVREQSAGRQRGMAEQQRGQPWAWLGQTEPRVKLHHGVAHARQNGVYEDEGLVALLRMHNGLGLGQPRLLEAPDGKAVREDKEQLAPNLVVDGFVADMEHLVHGQARGAHDGVEADGQARIAKDPALDCADNHLPDPIVVPVRGVGGRNPPQPHARHQHVPAVQAAGRQKPGHRRQQGSDRSGDQHGNGLAAVEVLDARPPWQVLSWIA
mmetsp:Transcript_141637/g.440330  ORF Transcript_141637/g.440330 Transcript_141637/m.440330 type:complete len:282 (-) Transcript_141637:162-1007(-)